MKHKPECWKNQAYQYLGVGGDLASCTCDAEDKMKHIHRFKWKWKWASRKIRCSKCGEPMAWEEVERRVNAAKILPASTVEYSSKYPETGRRFLAEALIDYAKTLRGEL